MSQKMVVLNIDLPTYMTLRLYQDSINFMKRVNPNKFRRAIDKETKIYKDVIKELNELARSN